MLMLTFFFFCFFFGKAHSSAVHIWFDVFFWLCNIFSLWTYYNYYTLHQAVNVLWIWILWCGASFFFMVIVSPRWRTRTRDCNWSCELRRKRIGIVKRRLRKPKPRWYGSGRNSLPLRYSDRHIEIRNLKIAVLYFSTTVGLALDLDDDALTPFSCFAHTYISRPPFGSKIT